jgi:glycine/serine hydroxymethyltransferase
LLVSKFAFKWVNLCRYAPGFIDFVKLEEQALNFRPKMLICGGALQVESS